MRIDRVEALAEAKLLVFATDGRSGVFDVGPYLADEAFVPLRDADAFARVANGSYFVEWECGADLSADTIEARWVMAQVVA